MKFPKHIGKTLTRMFLLVLCSILIGTTLMVGLYAIPTDRAFAHVNASQDMYGKDMFQYWAGNYTYSRLSNSTDSLILMHAIYRPYDSAVDNALLNPSPSTASSEAENLVNYLNGKEGGYWDYTRYWHGYLLYMIPGLQIFTVAGMKIVMMYVQFFLSMLVIYLLGKRNKTYMLLYGIVTLFINPVTTVMTFQNADIYCIMMIFMILLLKYNDWLNQKDRYLLFFALNGVLVAFIDYLTYPLVAYGIPLITVLLINGYSFKESLKRMILNSIAWCWGYAGMWMGKWIMADLLTGTSSIKEGFQAVLFRTVSGVSVPDKTDTYFFTLKQIFSHILDWPMIALAGIALLVLIFSVYRKKRIIISAKDYLHAAAAIALVGIVPFAWYFVVRNHTIVHPHLEYRQLAVSIWAVLVILAMPYAPVSDKNSRPS